jgi:hypothetical protein
MEFSESENGKIKSEEQTFPLRATGAWDFQYLYLSTKVLFEPVGTYGSVPME